MDEVAKTTYFLMNMCINYLRVVFSGEGFEEAVIIAVGVSFNRFRNIEVSLGSGFLSLTSSISHPECKL